MATIHMYPGLPLVYDFSSTSYLPQCKSQAFLSSPESRTKRDDVILKWIKRPQGVLTDPSPHRATDSLPGNGTTAPYRAGTEEVTSGENTDGSTTAVARREERKDSTRHRQLSHQEDGKNQLKFSIDRILGKSTTSATKDKDIPCYESSDMPTPPISTDTGAAHPTTSAENHDRLVQCSALRLRDCGRGIPNDWPGDGYASSRQHHDALHAGNYHPHAYSSYSSYIRKDNSLVAYCDPWCYAPQYPYHPTPTSYTDGHVSGLDAARGPLQPHPNHPIGAPRMATGARRKRSWSRAVFTSLQRKGLEKRFDLQKYVNKPDRRQLAAALGLTDAQVKVWFQNRRMKWRHTQRIQKQQQQHEESHEESHEEPHEEQQQQHK